MEEKWNSADAIEHTDIVLRLVLVIDRLPSDPGFSFLRRALDEMINRVNGLFEGLCVCRHGVKGEPKELNESEETAEHTCL